jgi:hypothetical protein
MCCVFIFKSARLIQDNNLVQGYKILGDKWLESCPKPYFRKNNRERKERVQEGLEVKI